MCDIVGAKRYSPTSRALGDISMLSIGLSSKRKIFLSLNKNKIIIIITNKKNRNRNKNSILDKNQRVHSKIDLYFGYP
jgi:hypothetical protein